MRKFALILTGFLVELTGAEVAPGVRKLEAGEPEALSQISQAKFRFGHGSVASALHDNKKSYLEIMSIEKCTDALDLKRTKKDA